nr:hypothetical protein [Micromonospora provocatoris]
MSTWGWRSHFYSLVPLGWALQAAGHEVRVASHPSMAATISTAGLAAVPLGEDVDFAEAFAGRIGAVAPLGGSARPAPSSRRSPPTAGWSGSPPPSSTTWSRTAAPGGRT